MPFIAPTFVQQATPSQRDLDLQSPLGPQIAADQATKDAALLAQFGRDDWRVTARVPITDAKGNVIGTSVQIMGPNGQPDSIRLDTDGNVIAGPKKTPTPAKTPAGTRTDSPAQTANATANTENAGTNSRNADTRAGAANANAGIGQENADTRRAGQQANAGIGQQNADTRSAAQSSTAGHQANQDENARTLADLRTQALAATTMRDQARIDYQNRQQQLNEDYRNQRLTLDQYNFESRDNHRKAQDSQASADLAEKALRDEQTAQYNQGLLTNKQTETAETSQHNRASEAQAASNAEDSRNATALTALGQQMRDEQTARDNAATRSETLLKDRSTLASGVNDALYNSAAGARNYGLGSTADVSALPQAAQNWATDMYGGQSIFDEAIKRVHEANPALSGTPEGAAYASLLSQVMEKQAQVQAGGFTAPGVTSDSNTTPDWQRADQPQTPPQDDGNAAPGMTGTVTPDDPRYLGTVIGAAIQHLNTPAFAQSDIPEGSNRRAPTGSFTAPAFGAAG